MSQGSKLLERMRANPRNDWTLDDVLRVARTYGVSCRRPGGGSSHATLSHPAVPDILTIPYARPIKVPYIISLVKFIDAIAGAEA